MNKYYTGVGSRETPANILQVMNKIAKYLSTQNYTVRHGNAQGADKAFDISPKEVYLPWDGFEGGFVDYKQYFLYSSKAYEYACEACPHFDRMKSGQKIYYCIQLKRR